MDRLHQLTTHNNVYIKVIFAFLLILLPFIGSYIGYTIGFEEGKSTAIVESEAPIVKNELETKKEEEVSSYPSQTGTFAVVKGDNGFTAELAEGWSISKAENTVTFSNDQSSIVISRDSMGQRLCLYPGDEGYGEAGSQNSPYAYPEFSTFKEMTAGDREYRRGSPGNDSETRGDMVEQMLCQKDEQDRYVDYTDFGHITYTYPPTSPDVLQEMDSIVTSLRLLE